MIVAGLSLTDFRNYATAEVSLAPGANLFVGKNGQGKTNLVEALGYLSSLGSHRVSTEHAMIRAGCTAAIIRATLRHDERELLVEVQINRTGANRAQVNRSAIKTRELPRYFSSVLFAPEDLALVRGEPSGRRRFLDELLILRNPRLSGVLSDYERVVRQRNTLLKSARATRIPASQLTTLDVWDERLIALGAEIVVARRDLIAALSPQLRAAYATIVGADHGPELGYLFSPRDPEVAELKAESDTDLLTLSEVQQELADGVRRVRSNELERAVTLIGPHRDDMVIHLNGLPARGYSSHGESWSLALSLKLASADVLRRESNTGDPVLILDDVFAELDEHRRARLAAAIGDFEQVLITAAVWGDVPEELRTHTIHISAGTIVEHP